MFDTLIKKILSARVYDVAIETPVHQAPFLSKRLGRPVLLKREDLQPVYSFKCRGAYNKMVGIPKDVLAKGVIAASAGNHAQGVALGAQKLKIPAVIVMPTTTPAIKVRSVKARGAQVILHGDSFDEAFSKSQELVDEYGYTYLHPFDDIEVMSYVLFGTEYGDVVCIRSCISECMFVALNCHEHGVFADCLLYDCLASADCVPHLTVVHCFPTLFCGMVE